MQRKWRIAVVICWAISLIVGFVGCKQHAKQLAEPMLISKTSVLWTFDVVGLSNGKPALLIHEVGLQLARRQYNNEKEFREAMQQRSERNILWDDDLSSGNKYAFYIDLKYKDKIEQALSEPIKNGFERVDIKILDNDPPTKSQIIRVDCKNNDDYFSSVYAVNNNRVTPLKYGDYRRPDHVLTAAIGIEWWFLTFIPSRIAIAIVFGVIAWKQRKQSTTEETGGS